MEEKSSLFSVKNDWVKIANDSIELCPKIKKEREKEILRVRFGINQKPATLQTIGDKYKITRERVRQIVNNGIKKISENCLSKETKKAINLIEDEVLKNGGFVSQENVSKALTNNELNQANGLKFVANLSKKINYIKNSNNIREGWLTKNLKFSKLKSASILAEKELENSGKTLTEKKIAEKIGLDPKIVKAALGANIKIIKTDDGRWGLASWPQINPKSIKDKSKYVMKKHGKPIHYEELAKKISKIGEKKVTKQSVHNELIKNKDFILVGRGIYALSEWGYKPGIIEEVIVSILKESDAPLHKSVIIEKVLEKRIVKPNTVALNLQKPRFKKVKRSLYTLN